MFGSLLYDILSFTDLYTYVIAKIACTINIAE